MTITLSMALELLQKKREGIILPDEIKKAEAGIKEIEAIPEKSHLPDYFREIYYNLILICNDLDEAFAMHQVMIEFETYEDRLEVSPQ